MEVAPAKKGPVVAKKNATGAKKNPAAPQLPAGASAYGKAVADYRADEVGPPPTYDSGHAYERARLINSE